MKPIMLVLAIMMAFAVLPSGVWAQDGESEQLRAEAERLRAEAEAAREAAYNTEDGLRGFARGRALRAAFPAMLHAEAQAARAEAEAARSEGDIKAANEAVREARGALEGIETVIFEAGDYGEAGTLGKAKAVKADIERELERANAALAALHETVAREAQAESVGLEEAARLVGERVREDYGVIFGIYENAELAVALAERALEAAESEEDYAEAWKRHRGAAQYRDGVNDIVVRAEGLANASVSSVNAAINYLSQAKDEDDNLRIHNLTELAKMAVGNAAENAVEVKNLRAQLEE